MLGGNLGSLLYGDVSVMFRIFDIFVSFIVAMYDLVHDTEPGYFTFVNLRTYLPTRKFICSQVQNPVKTEMDTRF